MKKQFLFLFLTLGISAVWAQTKSTRIGYIDMEYILQNVPSYTEAQNQLEEKAQKWKQEVEKKKNEIQKLADALKTEKPLLTRELIEEREAEIKFLETEVLEYQQKRFGANGDLMQQKLMLSKPIQDQVFTAVQDIAVAKKFDFIFDKSSHLTMLFAEERFNISDQVLRVITRTEKREQLSKKQQKELEIKEKSEDILDDNLNLKERQKSLDEKKEAREQLIADRKLQQEAKKQEFEERRKKLMEERNAKKNGGVSEKATPSDANNKAVDSTKIKVEQARAQQSIARQKTLDERKQTIENNKKAAEEKRIKILEERAAKKIGTVSEKAKTEQNETEAKTIDSIKIKREEARQQQIIARQKIIDERKKTIEENRKALEEKRNKAIEEKAALKKVAQ